MMLCHEWVVIQSEPGIYKDREEEKTGIWLEQNDETRFIHTFFVEETKINLEIIIL